MGNSQRAFSKYEGLKSQAGLDDDTTLQHSLNNGLIFDLIFDYIPKRDWKSVRRVNKTLHFYIQPRWREQMVYKLGRGKGWPADPTVTAKYLEKKHPAKSCWKDPLQLSDFPIRNIFIPSWGILDKYILGQLDHPRFWELYGPGLKRLHFDGVQIHEVVLLKRLLFELTPNLEEFRFSNCYRKKKGKRDLNTVSEYTHIPPAKLQKNLKFVDLHIADIGVYAEEDSGVYKPRFHIGWIEFFSVFPNIQKLKLQVDPLITKRPSDLLKLFEAIDIIRKANNNQVLNITKLQIYSYEVGFDHIDVIKNLSVFTSLPISILYIPTYFRNGIDHQIALVRAFKSTLRDLIMLGPGYGELYPDDMLGHGLTKLGLMSSEPCFSSFGFLSHTPNLEELELDDIIPMLRPEVSAEVANVAPLVYFKKLRFKLLGVTPHVEILGRLMPNVTTCICKVGPDGFRMLCQMWPNLKHLNLDVHFPSEDEFLEHLTQLKCLKTLKLTLSIHNGHLSDKFVFEGLLLMSSLTRIELGFMELYHITEEGRDALKGKLCDHVFDVWTDMFQRTH